MRFQVPVEAWWMTHHDRHRARRSKTDEPTLITYRYGGDEPRLDDDELNMLENLAQATPADDDAEPYEDNILDEDMDCWTAELSLGYCLGLAMEHHLFGSRDDVVQMIQWLALNFTHIPEADEPPAQEADAAHRWEQHIGHTYLTIPTNPSEWRRVPFHPSLGFSLWAAGRQVLTTFEFKKGELDGFITWLGQSLMELDIDPPLPTG